jgi:anti-sigma factor RsiW
MTHHSSVEQLSIYLDDRLGEPERRRLERHLAACDDCRRRLAGMRRVVQGLERLERTAPPPQLAHQVEQRIGLEAGRQRLLERVERRLNLMMAQPSILPTFALVIALAVIVYLFAYGLERHQQRGVPVILEPPAGNMGQELAESREVEGRVFEPRDGGWREQGSAGATPTLVLDLTTPDGRPKWIERYPELGGLSRELDGRVVLRLEEEWVEVILPAEKPKK